jgi:bacteriochlorophyllide a dehydrogenase
MMQTTAVVLQAPRQIALKAIALPALGDADVLVKARYSGISTGTEKLLYTGDMPSFPGMGYPLVPGYETVGEVVRAGSASAMEVGQPVFVPGANCYGEVRGLFGGSASHIHVPAVRVVKLASADDVNSCLLALAATAYHAVAGNGKNQQIAAPDLIVGHGVLGRLLARLTVAAGAPAPTVWETNPNRLGGAHGYTVCSPQADSNKAYRHVYDVSGDAAILDSLIQRLAPGGEIVLAGFYAKPLAFLFAPAFMREIHIRVAAQWGPWDMQAVSQLVATGQLDLSGLITHQHQADSPSGAYSQAFDDPNCLKMVLNWRDQ